MNDDSPGRMLRAAREKQGLHIAALAAAIKVAPRKLDALENDRWEDLPDATFARALAQTVCRTLKIDPRPVLELLPAPAAALEHAHAGLNAPFRRGREEPGTATAIRPMVWAALALMAAAVAVYLLPEGVFQSRRPDAATLATPAAPAQPAAAEAASGSGLGVETVAPTPLAAALPAPASLAGIATPVAGAADAATAPLVAALPPATSASPVAGPAVPPPGSATDADAAIVRLRTTQPSWVEVRDARGAVLLSRLVQPGEAVGFDRGLPLRLTIGNAAATQLTLRGRPVDVVERARDNVARLELQ